MLRSPRLVGAALCGLALLLALPAPVEARRRHHRRYRTHHRVRHPALAMRLRPLSPTWTSTTDGREVAIDGEPDYDAGPVRIQSTRHKLTRRACYQALRARRIRFKPGPTKNGLIAFPVIIDGHLHGVYFKNKYANEPMLADCQLVLALYRAAPVLRRHGIVKVLFTNTWRPPFWSFARHRSMPSHGRRMGNHPRGLAMDASVFIDRRGRRYEVQPHWEKLYGGPGNCVGHPRTQRGRLLRTIICELERKYVFRRILTPDSNWEHRHHFHFTAPRANEAFVRQRWAGRILSQPLPGTRTYKGWERWYVCYRIRNPRRRWRCYHRRRRHLPKAPRRFRTPPQKPHVALKLVIRQPVLEPELTAPAVEMEPRPIPRRPTAQPRTRPRARPRPRRRAPAARLLPIRPPPHRPRPRH